MQLALSLFARCRHRAQLKAKQIQQTAQLFEHISVAFRQSVRKNLHALPPEELADVPTVCGSLREALDALDADRDFLKKGDVFTDDQIDGYVALKREEVITFEQAPHLIEFAMYYSV